MYEVWKDGMKPLLSFRKHIENSDTSNIVPVGNSVKNVVDYHVLLEKLQDDTIYGNMVY